MHAADHLLPFHSNYGPILKTFKVPKTTHYFYVSSVFNSCTHSDSVRISWCPL